MEEPLKMLMHRLVLSELLHNPLVFSKPSYERIIKESCIKAARVEIFDVLPQPSQESYQNAAKWALNAICEEKRDQMPVRSYPNTMVLNPVDKVKMSEHLRSLREVVQPEQRTPEWYAMRNSLITASSASKVLFSEASAFALLADKVDIKPASFSCSVLNDNVPLEWGKKYEPLSVMYYEKLYDTKVQEYGCLIHREYKFIGASPDGINIKEDNPRLGRMLEIKNVFTREINGIPKEDYWVQMQIQMEVCDLNECDFLETKYKEHTSRDSYVNARENSNEHDLELRFGVMVLFVDNGVFHYEYGPLGMTLEEQDTWLEETREKEEKRENVTWYRNIYWELEKVSCVLVLRNRVWFAAAAPKMMAFWTRVEAMRSDHAAWIIAKSERQAKRKKKPAMEESSAPTTVCYLKTKTKKTI